MTVPEALVDGSESLAGLRRGASAAVTGIVPGTPPALARRLFDLGFRPGITVDCLRRAPLGSPTVYRVGETDICLRRGEAAHIRVEFLR